MSGRCSSRFVVALAIGLSLILSCGCDPNSSTATTEAESRIRLSGSSTVGPLAAEIAKRYEALNAGVRIDVQTGGSSRGIADAKSGLADIGMSSRALKASELDGRLSWPIAMDGVCFIVHAENAIGELSRSQLLSIIQGAARNWNEFGGPDLPIAFINRAAGRSELELVTQFFEVGADQLHADLIAGENQQGIKMVSSTPGAISYMSVGASEDSIERGTSIRMLPLGGVVASVENVENGSFPLSRPLIFVTTNQPSPAAEAFIRFAQSNEVSDLVRQLSYVPIHN